MNAVEMKNVCKAYGDFRMENVSFALPTGCILGMVGENGAGKSTAIRLIMNATRRDAGEITVLGCDNGSADFSQVKQDIGVVLDEAYFPGMLTAKDIALVLRNTFTRWSDATFSEYLTRFGLPDGKPFKDFSRGMRMKLSIAAALSHDAKLLLLDEATGGLDPLVRDDILDVLMEFTRDETHSVLLSSHILSDIEKASDYVLFLHEGRVLFFKEKDRLTEEYGMLRCGEDEAALLPSGAIAGQKKTAYGVECLVRRDFVRGDARVENAGLEDIVLMLAKGARKQ